MTAPVFTITSSVTAKEVWDAIEAGKPVFVRGLDPNLFEKGMWPAKVTLDNEDYSEGLVIVSISNFDLYALYPDGTFSDRLPPSYK